MMANKDTLKKLAKRYPECYPVHMDIKKLMPEKDALNLLNSGFRDCSWKDDECPSFFNESGIYNGDVMTLMAISEGDQISYTISATDIDEFNHFTNIDNAITYYNYLLLKGE